MPFAFAFCISNLNFLPKFGIFPIHIFEFPAKNLDSIAIGVVVVVVGVVVVVAHGDNRGTSSFGHSALNQLFHNTIILSSLHHYSLEIVSRMKENQKDLYYITGNGRDLDLIGSKRIIVHHINDELLSLSDGKFLCGKKSALSY